MQEALDVLEERIAQLRQAVRDALAQRDSARVKDLRAELRRAERAWDALVSPPEPDEEETTEPPAAVGPGRAAGASMLPVREQVHQALTLLGVPAAPKLISSVSAAFFTGKLNSSRLASLRRDEERSYRSAPNARPYYLCPALTYDLLAPARALLTVSTWPLQQRIVGPLSARVDFLTAAIRIADTVNQLVASADTPDSGVLSSDAERLLWQFASSIPGAISARQTSSKATQAARNVDPHLLRAAAQVELEVHADADRDTRAAEAQRARRQLEDIEQLFGSRLKTIRGSASGS